MAQPQRILVCGDVNGHYKQLFDRVNAVNKKGLFDMVICAGNFFSDTDEDNNGWMDILSGRSELNIPQTPIYALGPQNGHQAKYYELSGGSLWEKGFQVLDGQITFLGNQGILNTASGLTIAYATEESVDSLDGTSQQIDILITTKWPRFITKFMTNKTDIKDEPGNSLTIARLAKRLRPRYHLSSSKEIFFERQPYRNHIILQESARNVTRFISCAPVANALKAKWLYAFTIVPASAMDKAELTKQPEDTTENPYRDLRAEIRQDPADKPENVQFFYNMLPQDNRNNRGHNGDAGPRKANRRRDDGNGDNQQKEAKRPKLDPAKCWFCLSSPDVEKHLVVSIGEQAYLAAAKGGLNDDHLLIIPVNHIRSTLECEESELLSEIERFKTSLRNHFKEENKTVIFFERNFRSDHLQIQAIPIDASLEGSLLESVKSFLHERNLKFKEIPEGVALNDLINPGTPYFFMELSAGNSILVFIQRGQFFPLQLGREIIASRDILNCPEKIDWKACQLGRDQAANVVKEFREKFKKHDWTLDE